MLCLKEGEGVARKHFKSFRKIRVDWDVDHHIRPASRFNAPIADTPTLNVSPITGFAWFPLSGGSQSEAESLTDDFDPYIGNFSIKFAPFSLGCL